MPAKRSAMRKIKEVLRLKFEAKLSHEKIAAAIGMSKGAVSNAVQRALKEGVGWPLPAQLDEAGLEALMYRKPAPPARYAQPDYALIHQELKRKGVTLQLRNSSREVSAGRMTPVGGLNQDTKGRFDNLASRRIQKARRTGMPTTMAINNAVDSTVGAAIPAMSNAQVERPRANA